MLTIDNLSFSYGTKKRCTPVLKNLNISFSPGYNAILGPNGAGKTTLLKSIFGLLRFSGDLWFQGKKITTMSVEDRTKLMSYLPQMDLEVSTLTVLEMVLLGRLPELGRKVKTEDLRSVMDTLELLNITSLAPKPFLELSGGQKKMVFVAQTLVRKPKVILLDEPVNSLDLQRQLELCSLLRDIALHENIYVIAVLHDINLAANFAHNIAVLDDRGRLHSTGSPQTVITKTMLQEVYGVEASVNCDEHGVPTVSIKRSIRGQKMPRRSICCV